MAMAVGNAHVKQSLERIIQLSTCTKVNKMVWTNYNTWTFNYGNIQILSKNWSEKSGTTADTTFISHLFQYITINPFHHLSFFSWMKTTKCSTNCPYWMPIVKENCSCSSHGVQKCIKEASSNTLGWTTYLGSGKLSTYLSCQVCFIFSHLFRSCTSLFYIWLAYASTTRIPSSSITVQHINIQVWYAPVSRANETLPKASFRARFTPAKTFGLGEGLASVEHILHSVAPLHNQYKIGSFPLEVARVNQHSNMNTQIKLSMSQALFRKCEEHPDGLTNIHSRTYSRDW